MYAYPAKVDIMEGLHMPHPHAWQPEEEDWHLPENWEEIIYKALKERLAKHRSLKIDPEGVETVCDGQTKVIVKGISKEAVGAHAANIRAKRLPEPYKGHGVKYADEHIRRKVGKTG